MERHRLLGLRPLPARPLGVVLETELRDHVVSLFEGRAKTRRRSAFTRRPVPGYCLGPSREAGRKLGASNLLFL